MGREIVSISVPINSEVWHTIKTWQASDDSNVSVNICACIADHGQVVHQLAALRAEWTKLGKLLSSQRIVDGVLRTGSLSKEEWEQYFWTGE